MLPEAQPRLTGIAPAISVALFRCENRSRKIGIGHVSCRVAELRCGRIGANYAPEQIRHLSSIDTELGTPGSVRVSQIRKCRRLVATRATEATDKLNARILCFARRLHIAIMRHELQIEWWRIAIFDPRRGGGVHHE